MNLEEGSFLDSASTPTSASIIALLPLPTRQRLSGDFVTGKVEAAEIGAIDIESLVVLSPIELVSIFCLKMLRDFLGNKGKEKRGERQREKKRAV